MLNLYWQSLGSIHHVQLIIYHLAYFLLICQYGSTRQAHLCMHIQYMKHKIHPRREKIDSSAFFFQCLLHDIQVIMIAAVPFENRKIYSINIQSAFRESRRAVVIHEAKKKQHVHASLGLCYHYSELFT